MPSRDPALTLRKIRTTAKSPGSPAAADNQLPPDDGTSDSADAAGADAGALDLSGAQGDEIQTAEDMRLEEILQSEENVGAKFEISHKSGDGDWAFCSTCLLTDWGPAIKQKIAHQFGGGFYRARVRKADNHLGKQFDFIIDAALKPHPPEAEAAAGQLEPAGGMNQFLLTMLETSRREAAEARREAQAARDDSSKMMMGLVTAVIGRPQPSVSDALVQTLAEKAFKPSNQPSELTVLIGALVQLKKVMDIDRAPAEGAGKRDVFEILIEKLPDILSLLSKGAEAFTVQTGGSPVDRARQVGPPLRAAQPMTVAPAEAPVVTTGAPAPVLPADQEAAQFKTFLAAALPQLCAAADQQADPAELADKIADGLEDDQLRALQHLLQRDDWLAIMIDVHEPAMARSPWLTRLRNEILDIEAGPAAPEAAAPAAATPAASVLVATMPDDTKPATPSTP